MMIVMKATATEEDIRSVADRIESVGGRADISQGAEVTVIGAIGDLEHDQRVAEMGLETVSGVDHVMPILKPYRLAAAERRPGLRTVLEIGGRKIGGGHLGLIARPCTPEGRGPTPHTARIVQGGGAPPFPRGAPQPPPAPHSFPGTGPEGAR